VTQVFLCLSLCSITRASLGAILIWLRKNGSNLSFLFNMLPSPLITETFNKYNLSQSAQILLLENAKRFKLKNKGNLLVTGKTCRSIWLVENGCIKLSNNNDGKIANLSFALAGQFITDLKSLRLDTNSENFIESCGESIVIEFKKANLQALYTTSNEIMGFGRSILEELLIDQEEHSNSFKLHTPAERYHLILSRRPSLLQKVSLTDIASYLGISRETLTRIRQAE
jgi:CRP-like cAMP-binding protein